jgi:hypothetical protein
MIPFIIRIFHPRLKTEQYVALCKDPSFTNRLAYLCENCYLYVTMSSTVSGKHNYRIKDGGLLGTKGLNPNKLVKQKI